MKIASSAPIVTAIPAAIMPPSHMTDPISPEPRAGRGEKPMRVKRVWNWVMSYLGDAVMNDH